MISVVLYSVNENEEQGERAVSPPLNSSDIGIGLIFQSHLWQESKLVWFFFFFFKLQNVKWFLRGTFTCSSLCGIWPEPCRGWGQDTSPEGTVPFCYEWSSLLRWLPESTRWMLRSFFLPPGCPGPWLTAVRQTWILKKNKTLAVHSEFNF